MVNQREREQFCAAAVSQNYRAPAPTADGMSSACHHMRLAASTYTSKQSSLNVWSASMHNWAALWRKKEKHRRKQDKVRVAVDQQKPEIAAK